MIRSKQTLLLLFFLLAGGIVGSLLARLGQQWPFLEWLAYGQSIGLSQDSPLVLDLAVVRITFGFQLSLNLGQIIAILCSLLLYRKLGGR